ncbi:GAF domain-containing protein [Pseudomonas benzenivorans]|uniref:GAF domain-containing protein n=1 Tax=Pseudomonas benzenivorans TaxID=556533 RepID=A0ABY5H7P7_9PSED|nr:GAF domain-containing protein [Pseudomonas benzenivorans]UTW07086.1 GAF domain-containing protein [Pseudomonas benzenivorans]
MNGGASLDAIRPCLEGAVPASIATCDAAGTPNVTLVSQVHYVDADHVALSFQFFNKTRENILANPQATVFLLHPQTSARYRLALLYRRTETEGPLFESMKAKLAGIASHTGMSGVFHLRGADVYQVLDIEHVEGEEVPPAQCAPCHIARLSQLSLRLAGCSDLAGLLEQCLDGLANILEMPQAMVLLLDSQGQKLYTVASHGYQQSGVGSEFPVGRGIIGVAAQFRTPIRIAHMASEYAYSRAIHEHLAEAGLGDRLETEIAFPGLVEPHSQLSVPILAAGRLLGVLHVEHAEPHRFGYDEEDCLMSLASLLGAAILALQQAADCSLEEGEGAPPPAPPLGAPLAVRYYPANSSVFLGEDYLIKGVAGAIFWRLLTLHLQEQRSEFSNRELRMDPALKLPELDDNLEARLILLQRRLAERSRDIVLEKCGRGRLRLLLKRPVLLQEIGGR